jgi:3-methyladenine DNA glycosylase Tag
VLSFDVIRARAAERKGGEDALAELLPKVSTADQLAALGDDRYLSEMAKRVFCSGFAWTVIDKKWPGFEEAFLGFDPSRLLRQAPEFWDGLAADGRIVRNGQKIMSVAGNAQFVADIAAQHGSFGRFLGAWPAADEVGLLELLAKRGSRLGGHTGQYFLRSVGKDGFVLSRDVVLCLRDAGVDIAEQPTSKRDLAKIQDQFNAWAKQSGLPYTHVSRICAMSIGENVAREQMHMSMGEP